MHYISSIWTLYIALTNPTPIRILSPRQLRLCVEIVDYNWLGLELPMKIESWLSSIVQRLFYIGKCNFKQWTSLAFTSVPYMVMKIIGIPTVFNDSQLLADYHWHFHAYPMILSVYAINYILNFENKCTRTHTHTHTHARTYACLCGVTGTVIFLRITGSWAQSPEVTGSLCKQV